MNQAAPNTAQQNRAAASRLTTVQAGIVALAALVAGFGIGYMAASRPAISAAAPLAAVSMPRNDLLDDVISHYGLYVRQPGRLVELPAEQSADILQWLTTGTGVGFRIPDLNAVELEFLGARLFSAAGSPVGLLFYRRLGAEPETLAVAFTKTLSDDNRSFEQIRNDTGIVGWVTPLATYMIVGPSAAADLDTVAAKVAGLI